MSVSKKLFALLLSSAGVTLLACTMGYMLFQLTMLESKNELSRMEKETMLEFKLIHDSSVTQSGYQKFFNETDADNIEKLLVKTQESSKEIVRLIEALNNADSIKTAFRALSAANIKIINFIEKGSVAAAIQISIEESNPAYEKLIDAIEDHQQKNREVMTQNITSTNRTINQRGLMVYSICGVCLLLYLTYGIRLRRDITTTLTKARIMMDELGQGLLGNRLNMKRKDEIGQMATAMDTMADNLTGMIRDIGHAVMALSSSSVEMSEIAGKMTSGAENMLARSNGVAAATERMSANLNNVAAASEQASTNVNMVAAASEQMTATVQEIAHNSGKARGITETAVMRTNTASAKVNELGQAALQISKVTEVITEISEQTNLLALNATIEAARAGEAGKGFAVVANEIKELAKQTATATQEIKSRVEGIQNSTNQTVAEIGQISKVIDEVNDIVSTIATAVEEQSVSSREISNNISQASQGIDDVNQNVNQTSAMSSSINSDIANVSKGVLDISTVSSQVDLKSKELAQVAAQLQQLMGHFKI